MHECGPEVTTHAIPFAQPDFGGAFEWMAGAVHGAKDTDRLLVERQRIAETTRLNEEARERVDLRADGVAVRAVQLLVDGDRAADQRFDALIVAELALHDREIAEHG